MGITYIEGKVKGPAGEASAKFFVDSGARYTLLLHATWKEIGLQPKRSMRFVLADGTEVERSISECLIRLPQGEGHTPVILGQEKDAALLGVVTLEELGLVFNPFERSLQPAQMTLMSAM
jgi:aspartyl protease family protein